MAVKINGHPDDRVERILEDPSGYFAKARRRARDEVKQEMTRTEKRARGKLKPA
jgi:hypothetical protein